MLPSRLPVSSHLLSISSVIFFLTAFTVVLSSSRLNKWRLFMLTSIGSVADRDAFTSCESSSVRVIMGLSTETMSSAILHWAVRGFKTSVVCESFNGGCEDEVENTEVLETPDQLLSESSVKAWPHNCCVLGEYSDAVQACSLKDIDMDGLYEEYGMMEAILSSSEMEGCHSEDRYLKLFSKAEVPLVNLRKVSAYIFSIPCSNAHTERVFSMMTSAWRNERNRLDVDSVKAELQICVNFTFECTDMYQRLLTNKKLLEAARKEQKYRK
ncbi:hypothetical protein F7725_013610 [Dissostichus mawsoni]|uniref:HAT C-terminal dimerisation domain-containing protein n=1 Tax=Dissostichus mawsoni TaxID=36200 RepID=A0A7J5Y6D6_DISMA|nr:hypothetical protein F7725_013610 [Dissostichus mawsoni]